MEKPLKTPAGKPFDVPSKTLAAAITDEWKAVEKYSPGKLPLTTLVYTAIDRIGEQKDMIVETLLVYIDTDTISYRATGSKELADAQERDWNPILGWVKKQYGATWEVTSGVMPIEQPEALHKAVKERLSDLNAMQLSACCLLASGFSSLALMLAVLEGHINAEKAFVLSRLEEESQAKAWGRDSEADARAARLQSEILTAERFLHLLAST